MFFTVFYIGENSNVIIMGTIIVNMTVYIHFNSKIKYSEKHYGKGNSTGERILNPTTIVNMEKRFLL